MKKFILSGLLIIACLSLPGTSILSEKDSLLSPFQTFTLHSAFVNDNYQIYVQLPPGYEESPDKHYETVYFLDANWNAGAAHLIMEKLLNRHKIQPLILVGLCPIQALEDGYDGTGFIRCRDLTPTQVQNRPGSGRADDFASFLNKELIPYIDEHYQTMPNPENRCLVGHSFGGLFSLYMLFFHQDVFEKYMIFSPSVNWDKQFIMKTEEEYAENNHELNATVYTTVGSLEERLRPDYEKMVSQLKKRHYEKFDIHSEVISGAEHVTSWNPSFERGLLRLYKNQ